MTDNTNTTKAQKTDIEGLLGADKVKPFHKRGGFWLVLLVFLGILFAVYYFFFRGSQGQVGFVTQPLTERSIRSVPYHWAVNFPVLSVRSMST